jgi:hypothetical protein
MWGLEGSTVRSTARSVKYTITLLQQMGVEPQYPPLGPFPVRDDLGYGVAVAMVLKSLEPGKYGRDYQQFSTIRALRAGFFNVYSSSVTGALEPRSTSGSNSKMFLGNCQSQSIFFEKFSRGCFSHMGQDTRQDMAVSLPVMHAFMEILDEQWIKCEDETERCMLAHLGAFSVIGFGGSFRGPEVLLTDLHGLRTYLSTPRRCDERDYVVIPLLGRVKNELGEAYHLTPLASQTKSGLEIEKWVRRLVTVQEKKGLHHGPAFTLQGGRPMRMKDIEMEFLDRLQMIQEADERLIPKSVDVHEAYGLNRSHRRGSTSEARSRGVGDREVRLMNRWRSFDVAEGRRPRLAMQDHYSDIRIMIPALLIYSSAL